MRGVAIDTSAPVVGIAAFVGEVVAVRQARVSRGAETLLVPWIVEAMAEVGLRGADVEGIAVVVGPGAFTGLRVGLATAVGLGLAWDKPLVGVSSLASRGRALGTAPLGLVVLDARKDRVYGQWLVGGALVGEAVDESIEAVLDAQPVPGEFVATGEGALLYRGAIEARGGSLVGDPADPALRGLVIEGTSGFEQGRGVAAAAIAPVYIRPADAKKPGEGR
jgi:tRNA threonylcarbamoyladenosine biosynthesis protein TsaB